MSENQKEALLEQARKYSSIKYTLAIIEIVYLLGLLFLFAGLGISRILASVLSRLTTNNYIIVAAYLFIIYITYYVLNFPLNFYHSFVLEHKFCLSRQKISDWLKDQIKASIISYLIGLICLYTFYYILRHSPNYWWLFISLFWIFFNLILAKLVPVVIIPLFFKYKKLSDDTLKQRIINLADKMEMRILDVFEIDFSKKTLKANAAFVGLGNTKRVILADTLKDRYSYDEIEVILAHEFAHYQLRHLLKLVLINSSLIIVAFYLIFKTQMNFLALFGLPSLSNIAALPLIFIYLIIFSIVMQPLENYISRRLERNADTLALKETGAKDAFISMMEKLATQNLADRNPHPIIKFFFFDHPPVDERIAIARTKDQDYNM